MPHQTRIATLFCLLAVPAAGCPDRRDTPPKKPAPPAKKPTAGTGSAPATRPARRVYPEQITDRNPDSLLGGERGLDHLGVAVRDLDGAKRAYVALGFGNPQRGKLPNGIENVNFYFGDTTYLELLTYYDKQKNRWVASFVDKHGRGAMFMALAVFSFHETAKFLGKRGLRITRPLPGRVDTPGKRRRRGISWFTFNIKDTPLPGDATFFIAYNRRLRNFVLAKVKRADVRRKAFSHPNTALGLRAAWLAVKDLAAAQRAYAKIGLPAAAGKVRLPRLGAAGKRVPVGKGTVLLLGPGGAKVRGSPLGAFMARRGDGIIGLSIEVEKLAVARKLAAKAAGAPLPPYDGVFGRSILVPPKATHGVWLELYQRAR